MNPFRSLLVLICVLNSCSLFCQANVAVTFNDFPRRDLPNRNDSFLLKGLSSTKFYYGIGMPVDYVKARKAAFLELHVYKDSYEPMTGWDILVMIYLNGLGVTRNATLCERLAATVLQERPDTLMDIIKSVQKGDTSKFFDLMDEAYSTYYLNVIVGIKAEQKTVVRNRRLDSLKKTWSALATTAFTSVRPSARLFFNARVLREVEQSGTDRSIMMQGENEELEKVFFDHILAWSSCSTNFGDDTRAMYSDMDLNGNFKKLMARPDDESSTVKMQGIRETQRLWLKYRDSMAEFGTILCPSKSMVDFLNILTDERAAQLKELINE